MISTIEGGHIFKNICQWGDYEKSLGNPDIDEHVDLDLSTDGNNPKKWVEVKEYKLAYFNKINLLSNTS